MSLDRRVIYLTMLVVVSLPLLNPLGIPLEINKGTRDVYEQLDAVPAGKRVLFSITIRPDHGGGYRSTGQGHAGPPHV